MQWVAGKVLNNFARDTRGSVLVEFAVTLPVLLVMFVGCYALSDMIHCSRKVTIATRALTDMVSRDMSPSIVYNAPSSATATSYLSASAVVMAPFSIANATEQISLLRVCDSTHAYVVWTQAQTQSASGSTVTPTTSTQTAGTLPANATQSANNVVSIPANMVTSQMVPTSPDGSDVCNNLAPGTSNTTQVGTAGGWLFRGQVNYAYTPVLQFGPITTSALSDNIYMSPRLQ